MTTPAKQAYDELQRRRAIAHHAAAQAWAIAQRRERAAALDFQVAAAKVFMSEPDDDEASVNEAVEAAEDALDQAQRHTARCRAACDALRS